MKVSVILPSRERPEQLRKCIERLFHTALWSTQYDLEVVGVVDGDPATEQVLHAFGPPVQVLSSPERMGALLAWNWGVSAATGDVLVLAADDVWFYHGWLNEALDRLAELPNGDGLVGFNDLARDGNELATHFLVSRRFAVEHLGGCLVTPRYHHYFCDNEANERAKRAGRFVWAFNAVVEHRHAAWGKAPVDGVYSAVSGWLDEDRNLFMARQAAGFPDDFAAMLRM